MATFVWMDNITKCTKLLWLDQGNKCTSVPQLNILNCTIWINTKMYSCPKNLYFWTFGEKQLDVLGVLSSKIFNNSHCWTNKTRIIYEIYCTCILFMYLKMLFVSFCLQLTQIIFVYNFQKSISLLHPWSFVVVFNRVYSFKQQSKKTYPNWTCLGRPAGTPAPVITVDEVRLGLIKLRIIWA